MLATLPWVDRYFKGIINGDKQKYMKNNKKVN